MSLFHFGDDPGIAVFVPRTLRVAVDRGPDRAWLNGPLVWATDSRHGLLYLSPRECPRIVIWPTDTTSPEDRDAWFGGRSCRAIAFIEDDWRDRLRAAALYRYALPACGFEDIDAVGMWVSRRAVVPSGLDVPEDLPGTLDDEAVELRNLPRLTPPALHQADHAACERYQDAQCAGWGTGGMEPFQAGTNRGGVMSRANASVLA